MDPLQLVLNEFFLQIVIKNYNLLFTISFLHVLCVYSQIVYLIKTETVILFCLLFVCFSQGRASLCWTAVAVVVKGRERGREGGIINSFNKKLVHVIAKIS